MRLFEKRIEFRYIYGTLLGTAIHFSCNHPHISKIENTRIENQTLVIQMKHVSFKLNDIIHDKKLLYQLVQAVKYLHDNNIVHCDIKHENVLVSKDGILLNDFGAATYSGYPIHIDCSNGCIHLPSDDLKTGIIDTKFDIYALGCLFRESYEHDLMKGVDEIDFDLFYELILQMTYEDKRRRCDINFVEQHPFFDGARQENIVACVKPFKFKLGPLASKMECLLHANVMLDYIKHDDLPTDLYKLTKALLRIVFDKKDWPYVQAISISNACKMLACALLNIDSAFNLNLAVQSIDIVLNALYQ